MELSDEILTEISYVQMSKYRIKVMKTLEGDVKIPTVIAKDSGIKTNHISKVLAELKAHELVKKNKFIGMLWIYLQYAQCIHSYQLL